MRRGVERDGVKIGNMTDLVRPLSFGIFAADNVQQIQFALLQDCRDDTTTRNSMHRLLQWLRKSGEDSLVAERALRRRIIAGTVAEQAGV